MGEWVSLKRQLLMVMGFKNLNKDNCENNIEIIKNAHK